MVPRIALALTATALMLLAAGCGEEDEPVGAGSPGFEDATWVVRSGLDVPGLEQAAPTASFRDGKVSGSTGCNRYTGSYEATATTLELSQVSQTEMACGPPGDAVERAFTAALPRVAGWQMDGDELVLVDDEDREVLRLAQASPVGDWDVTALRTPDAVTGPLEGTELTVDLAADGTVTGSAGCNRYRATFAVDGDALRIERGAATTRKTCPSPDGVMEQEAQLLEALASVARFERAGGTLTLLQEDGTIALTLVPR